MTRVTSKPSEVGEFNDTHGEFEGIVQGCWLTELRRSRRRCGRWKVVRMLALLENSGTGVPLLVVGIDGVEPAAEPEQTRVFGRVL